MKENILVVGQGKIGKPMLDTLRAKGFAANGYDVKPDLSECTLADAVARTTAAIFIVPTPSNPDGSFSNGYLLDAIREVMFLRPTGDYLFIVMSTTVPGSCGYFESLVGKNICYKPEFIRLEHVREDLVNPAFMLIGEGCKAAGDRCEAIYRQIADVPSKRMSLTEAELAKITLNCALTMKISLANQLHMVAEEMGCDSRKIMDAVGSDPRIGHGHMFPGAPYGGPCLPRDNRMFRYVASKVGVDARLSLAADEINERMQVHKLLAESAAARLEND